MPSVFQKKGVKKSTFLLDIGVSVWYNTTMNNKNNEAYQAYQANVHALYQRNRQEFVQRVWKTLGKNLVPMDKKDENKLDIPTPIWYNTTINNKER